MKVWFITRSLAEFACRWAKPRIARMGLMVLITEDKMSISWEGGEKKIDPPGNTTTFRTGIDLSIWQFHSSEVAGLEISRDCKE
jgi:hypothetical protein